MSSSSREVGGSVSGVETEAAAWCRPAGTAANSPGKPIPWNTQGSPQCIATVAIIVIVITILLLLRMLDVQPITLPLLLT